MEITKENVMEAIEVFKKMDSGNRCFTEAYKKGESYFFKRHKLLIVPSEIINVHFGCNKYRMSAELVEMLQKVGAKGLTDRFTKTVGSHLRFLYGYLK